MHNIPDRDFLTQNQRSTVEMTTKKRTTRKGTAGRSNKDAIALLKNDHKNVKQLLKRLESTTDRNSSQREQLLEEIENEVKVHTTIEEEIFYPAFKQSISEIGRSFILRGVGRASRGGRRDADVSQSPQDHGHRHAS